MYQVCCIVGVYTGIKIPSKLSNTSNFIYYVNSPHFAQYRHKMVISLFSEWVVFLSLAGNISAKIAGNNFLVWLKSKLFTKSVDKIVTCHHGL